MSTVNETDRSWKDLVRELRDESSALVREEVALAKAEMGEKVNRVSRNAVMLVVGGAIAHLGLIFLLLALAAGIEALLVAADLPFHGDWLAPLIVGLVVGIVGVAMLIKAKNTLAQTNVVPERTVESIKEDKEWLQKKAR